MKQLFLAILGLGLVWGLAAQVPSAPKNEPDLAIGPGDVRIDQSMEGGYILYIRAKGDIHSIILTESTADPKRKLDSYTLRSKEVNPINGNEKRLLDGKFIESSGMHFLLSSTVVPDTEFGQAYRIFVPYVVVFGYPSARYGEISLLDGAYFNIRSFAKPFADYSGAWKDNPYTIRLTQKASSGPGLSYNKEAVKAFERYVSSAPGSLTYSKGEGDLVLAIKAVLAAAPAGAQDVGLCLDASISLENDAPYLRQKIGPLLQDFMATHPGSRIALVQFRDYLEDFLYKITPFSSDVSIMQGALDNYLPSGGRDTPEAVNEGLYAALTELDWETTSRLLILVGDAPPHPVPRGSVNTEMVLAKLREQAVRLQAIILPD